jgi:1-acyl-sn-glycerol-3-phosphate acyltransferase
MSNVVGTLRVLLAALLSIGFAIIALVTIPFDRSGAVYRWNARTWARCVLAAGGITVRVKGLEKLDRGQHYVFVCNHASVFDIPAVLAALPYSINLVYKKELERVPVFGWGLKWGADIGIDRGSSTEARQSLDEAVAKIRGGISVLLYAEGTRTLDGKLQPFKRGAFNLAVRAGVPVVPLTINRSFGILPKGSLSVRPGTIELMIESPISMGGRHGKEAEVQLMEQVHTAIAAHYIDQ